MTTDTKTVAGDVVDVEDADATEPTVEVLVEEISIDGMCGVY